MRITSEVMKGNSNRGTHGIYCTVDQLQYILDTLKNVNLRFEWNQNLLFIKPRHYVSKNPSLLVVRAHWALDVLAMLLLQQLIKKHEKVFSQNLLAAVYFDLSFSVLLGWEGCVHDSAVLRNAFTMLLNVRLDHTWLGKICLMTQNSIRFNRG